MEWIDSAQHAAMWLVLACFGVIMLMVLLFVLLAAITIITYVVCGFLELHGLTRDESLLGLFVLPLVICVGSAMFILWLEILARLFGGR